MALIGIKSLKERRLIEMQVILGYLKSKRVQGWLVLAVAIFFYATGVAPEAVTREVQEIMGLIGIIWNAFGSVVARGPLTPNAVAENEGLMGRKT